MLWNGVDESIQHHNSSLSHVFEVADLRDDVVNLIDPLDGVLSQPHNKSLHGATEVVQEELVELLRVLILRLIDQSNIVRHFLVDGIKQLEQSITHGLVITVLNDVVYGLDDLRGNALLLDFLSFDHLQSLAYNLDENAVQHTG